MNKSLLAGCLLLVVGLLSSPTQAQNESSGVRFGAGLVYGDQIDEAGFTINALFGIDDKLSIQPSFMYYFTGNNITYWELNGDLHYGFHATETVNLYAVGGLSFVHFGFEEVIAGNRVQLDDEALGLNIGIGSDFVIDSKLLPFAELKYTIGDYDQLVLTAGVRF